MYLSNLVLSKWSSAEPIQICHDTLPVSQLLPSGTLCLLNFICTTALLHSNDTYRHSVPIGCRVHRISNIYVHDFGYIDTAHYNFYSTMRSVDRYRGALLH